MNTQEQLPAPAPELPEGYREVVSVEPEARDVASALLADASQRTTSRIRKNMWALRTKVTPSLGPIVRVEDTEGKLHGYAWNTKARIEPDVKLERRLAGKNCKQLLAIRRRAASRAVILARKAEKTVLEDLKRAMFERVGFLRNVSSAADYELRFERWNEQTFKNPDGN